MHENNPTGQWLATEVQAGNPVAAGEYRLTPMAKATRIHIPGTSGGLIWNRPASIVAETPDGETVFLPIKDYTRIAQAALLGSALAISAIIWLLSGLLRKN